MNKDRIFFDPCLLALGKGFVYLLAFLTGVFFVNAGEKVYYFGIIMYCCGCLCDYIEVAAYRTDKCVIVRRCSAAISILIAFNIILAFSTLYVFDTNVELISNIQRFSFWLNLYLTVFWAIPLACGIYLMFVSIKKEEKQDNTGHAVGFHIKP
ncbi:MAG: hypothetical protein E7597_08480 [Ruminococcaceae bacterium]|nr:hypothetical protein [Oscillospiraceae bacterium]